jgi:hypothetical protein
VQAIEDIVNSGISAKWILALYCGESIRKPKRMLQYLNIKVKAEKVGENILSVKYSGGNIA